MRKRSNKISNIKTLDQFVDEQYGNKGTSKREKFEKGFHTFKAEFLKQQNLMLVFPNTLIIN